eukprot:753636-Hanusia_phi.AAC.1
MPAGEVVGCGDEHGCELLLDRLVDVSMVCHDVRPVDLRVVPSSAPAVAVVEHLVRVPVLEEGVVVALACRPVQFSCCPEPVVTVILVIVLSCSPTAASWVFEASYRALGVEEEKLPGLLGCLQVELAQCAVVGPEGAGGGSHHGSEGRSVMGRPGKGIADGLLVVRETLEKVAGRDLQEEACEDRAEAPTAC